MSDLAARQTYGALIKRIWTSTVMLITAFIAATTLLEALIATFAKFLRYGVKIRYNLVSVFPNDWHYWSKARVTVVYLTSPLICIALGLIIFNFLKLNKDWGGKFRPFAFWFMICLVNMPLAHLFFSFRGIREEYGLGFYQTFAIVATWFGLNSEIMGAFGAVSIVLSMGFGLLVRNELLKFNYSTKSTHKPSGKSLTVLQLFIMPVLISALPLIGLCTSYNVFPSCLLTLNLLIISVGMFARNFNDEYTIKRFRGDILNRFPIFETALCVVIWFAVFKFFKQ